MIKSFLVIDLNGETYLFKSNIGENKNETLAIITKKLNKSFNSDLKKDEINLIIPMKGDLIGISMEFSNEFLQMVTLKKGNNINEQGLTSWLLLVGEIGYVVLSKTAETEIQTEENFKEEVFKFVKHLSPFTDIKIINPNRNKRILVIPFVFSGETQNQK
jgi:hypothetical protein